MVTKLIPYKVKNSILTKILSQEKKEYIEWVFRRFGKTKALKSLIKVFVERKTLDNFRIGDLNSNILMRPNKTDRKVYDQIFVDKEFDMTIPEPDVIVDAGAHIGLASLFFANKYPQARILALEPALNNYKLLNKNTKKYSNIETVRAALWDCETKLQVKNPNSEPWGFRLIKDEESGSIPAIGINGLKKKYEIEKISLLKMDIEGSEKRVFEKSNKWICGVENIIVELHERYATGCTYEMERVIDGQDYHRSEIGENILLRRRTGR